MKPLNSAQEGCDPISSNCVVWSGKDIPCVNLCKGDSVSDVVFKLATELCTIMDELDISNYDLSCFNLTSCPPEDFQQLLQFLISRLCVCCGVTPPDPGTTGCPDCVVSIAPCFYYVDQFGDTVTTMQLTDYVHAIGNKVCDIVNQITIINQTLNDLNIRVTALENEVDPVPAYPNIIPMCVLPSVPTPVDVVVSALEQEFCELEEVTGTPNALLLSILKECVGLSGQPTLGIGGGNMSGIPGWVMSPVTVADTITNIWLTICDLRSAVINIQSNCCPQGCEGIELDFSAAMSGSNILILYLTGTVPPLYVSCSTYTPFTISDTLGNSYIVNIDILALLNGGGYNVDLTATPIVGGADLSIIASPCFDYSDESIHCQSVISTTVINQSNCPTVTLTPGFNTIGYSFVVTSVFGVYTIQLYDGLGITLLDTQVQNIAAPATVTGTFIGLTVATTYRVRILVQVGAVVTTCEFTITSTLPNPCPPPTGVVSEIIIL